ncbi:MAG: glutamate 5-kinase [Proteobacteria bacterium]|nr:glutamate 5-kinase [Pseudomonadota bacterium]
MSNDRKNISAIKRLVVKVGSGVLTQDMGLNLDIIASLARQISEQMDLKREVILVSSGAVASGVKKIGLTRKPEKMPEKQAAAAIGQAGLILEYEKVFARHGKNVAQILLTDDDLSNRKRFLNARNTLNTLLTWGVLPIINENDTVAVEEIKFGDNDSLSARVALLLSADLLINLTDIDGLYDKDPRKNTDALRIKVVTRIGKQIEALACGIPGAMGTGGMLTKIKAARKMTAAGVPMIIASGKDPVILEDLFAGKDKGTFFAPKNQRLASRKSWIAFNAKPAGVLVVDEGAKHALLKGGKSLLPSGVTTVRGDFKMGSPVELRGPGDTVIGMGLVNYSSLEIDVIKGLKTDKIKENLGYKEYDEVIHRDNFAATGE